MEFVRYQFKSYYIGILQRTRIKFFFKAHCYEIVKKETEEMQEAIQTELGLSPVEQDVVVLYEGEKEKMGNEFWKVRNLIVF